MHCTFINVEKVRERNAENAQKSAGFLHMEIER